MPSEPFSVEVVWAEPCCELRIVVSVSVGTTAGQVLALSCVKKQLGERLAAVSGVGVFGRRVPLDQVLLPGDRLEIYRPLKVDPKESRRLRAKQQA